MSTPHGGGSRRPSATKATAAGKPSPPDEEKDGKKRPAKAGAAKPAEAKVDTEKKPASKTASKAAPAKGASRAASRTERSATATRAAAATKSPATKVGAAGKGPKKLAPVKVSSGRNWGPIVLFGTVIAVALGIIGFGAYKVWDVGLSVEDRVERIEGAVNYRDKIPNVMKPNQHEWGAIKYDINPPVAGKHNPNWMNCVGTNVYDAPIATEHAVHSMEHGAVWITYNPAKLSKDDIEKLAAKVRGKDFMLMSPYENLDRPISIQAWRFQLKVDSATDSRIDQFIKVTRVKAGIEASPCSDGITETGTTPRDLGKPEAPASGAPSGA